LGGVGGGDTGGGVGRGVVMSGEVGFLFPGLGVLVVGGVGVVGRWVGDEGGLVGGGVKGWTHRHPPPAKTPQQP